MLSAEIPLDLKNRLVIQELWPVRNCGQDSNPQPREHKAPAEPLCLEMSLHGQAGGTIYQFLFCLLDFRRLFQCLRVVELCFTCVLYVYCCMDAKHGQ